MGTKKQYGSYLCKGRHIITTHHCQLRASFFLETTESLQGSTSYKRLGHNMTLTKKYSTSAFLRTSNDSYQRTSNKRGTDNHPSLLDATTPEADGKPRDN